MPDSYGNEWSLWCNPFNQCGICCNGFVTKLQTDPKQTFTACIEEERGILGLLLQDALFLPAIQSSLAVTAEAKSNCDMSH